MQLVKQFVRYDIQFNLYVFCGEYILQINDIFTEGIVKIPAVVKVPNEKYLNVDGITDDFYKNIKNKNIEYFEAFSEYIHESWKFTSYKGILYGMKIAPSPYPYCIFMLPPKIKSIELPLTFQHLDLKHFNYNKFINKIELKNNIDDYFIEDRDTTYFGNLIYKNKAIRRVNNKWKVL